MGQVLEVCVEEKNHLKAVEPATAIVAGGCLLSIPALIFGGRWAVRKMESDHYAMVHRVEEVELDPNVVPPEQLASLAEPMEALEKFVRALKQTTEQFEKTGARFTKSHYERESNRLALIRERLSQEKLGDDPKAQNLLVEADQQLARYSPQ